MKAIRVHRHGGADVLACEDIDIGEPEPGEVRVRNWAIGVNFVDTYLRNGVFSPPRMPFTPGKEGVAHNQTSEKPRKRHSRIRSTSLSVISSFVRSYSFVVRGDSCPAICRACSSRPSFSRYIVMPVARQV
jgi:hypothetical protein